ncbi:MAG: 2,3-bisphosphoglycerate-independent phosphoglycerate mutase [Gammaproteobacteria bacterium]|nr:2,3-bisphosphoglycerate-independent phosphoglycerate mutase [Gammaproteobacteria bacterium]
MSVRHKGLMVILDGLGDQPSAALDGATPLEAAHTPVMDRIVANGLCGLVDPLLPGMPVSTHTGTGILLGLAPYSAFCLSRGPVEAAGIGLDVQAGDVTIRCNFATLEADGEHLRILDRRAGRIREGVRELTEVLHDVPLGAGITGSLYSGTHHRAVLRLTGSGLSAAISDTDPGSGGMPHGRVSASHPLLPNDPAAAKTADALNRFVREAFARLQGCAINQQRKARGLPPANGIITRGAGILPPIDNLVQHIGLRTALIAGESTVLGLAKLFGFTVYTDPSFTSSHDTDLAAKAATARSALNSHDLVFIHIKGSDICSHDRDPKGKTSFLTHVDKAMAPVLKDELVIGVSGDHSTDCNTGRHCGAPVPSLLYSPGGRQDLCREFGEKNCMRGGLGRISGNSFIISLLDAMGALHQFSPAEAKFFR